MKDIKKITKSTGTYFLGSVLSKVIVFFMLPLYTAYIPVADMGYFDSSIAVITFFSSVLFLDIGVGILRFMFENKNEGNEKKAIYSGLTIFVEFGIIIFAMIMAWGLYIALKNLKLYQSISISEHAKKYSKATMVFMVVFTPLSVMSSSISAMPNFWLLLGIVCAITNINYKKTIKRS